MSNLKQSILRTVAYADCFQYALSAAQLHHYLISENAVSKKVLHTALRELVAEKALVQQKELYCLPKREHLFLKRQRSEVVSAQKMVIAQRKAALMARMPWIEGILITGNVAMDNAEIDDDIDMLILTRESYVWLTRLMVLIIYGSLNQLRLRRHAHSSVKDKLCLNMYLDTSVLEMPQGKQNIYTAHEVVQVKPILNRHYAYERFLSANAWVAAYLPHSQASNLSNATFPQTSRVSSIITRLNQGLFWLQHHYMKSHLSRELIDVHRAFFHPRDTSGMVIKRYVNRCRGLGIPSLT